MNTQDLIIEIGRRVDKVPEAHRSRYKLVMGAGAYESIVLAAQEAAHKRDPSKRISVVKTWSGMPIELDPVYGANEWRVV